MSFGSWPGGLYYSPSFAGSRGGAPIVGAWAIMKHMGREGYNNIKILNSLISDI